MQLVSLRRSAIGKAIRCRISCGRRSSCCRWETPNCNPSSKRNPKRTPLSRWQRPCRAAARGRGAAGGDDDWDRIATLPDRQGLSLYAHVAAQIAALPLDRGQPALASVFLDELEPSGWLGPAAAGSPNAARIDRSNAAEALLHRSAAAGSAGCFARTLAECLRRRPRTWLLSPLFDPCCTTCVLLASPTSPGWPGACACDVADLRPVLRTFAALTPSRARGSIRPRTLSARPT